jgi:pseudouridine synthase
MIRLNKFLSQAGISSRREADRLIEQGRVSVNGEAVLKLGRTIDEAHDRVSVDGKPVKAEQKKIYLLLNKPVGYLVTLSDPFQRPTVLKLLPRLETRLFPVGRLDFESEGLLLMTNDGELAYRLMHPRFVVKKEYSVKVNGCPTKPLLSRLEKGIYIEGKKTAPAKIFRHFESSKSSQYRIVIHEGRKREIRKMFEAIGHPVIQLRRVKMAGLTTKGLKPGGWRYLTEKEVNSLKRQVNLKA